jgi:hypothetical protein
LRIQKRSFLGRVLVRKPPASKLLLVGEVEGFALGEYLVGEVWGDFLEVLDHGL